MSNALTDQEKVKLLADILREMVEMVEYAGYGGSNKGTEKRHIEKAKRILAQISKREERKQ